jgi:hypothetical protein
VKNITVTLDERMAIWLRQSAAQRGVSVSRFLGDLVHERMREAREYNEAMRQFLAEKPFFSGWIDGRRPTREEIYDRARAREDLARDDVARKAAK